MEKQYIFFDTPAGCRAGVIAGVVFSVGTGLAIALVPEPLWLFAIVVVVIAAVPASVAVAVDRRAVRRMARSGPSAADQQPTSPA